MDLKVEKENLAPQGFLEYTMQQLVPACFVNFMGTTPELLNDAQQVLV